MIATCTASEVRPSQYIVPFGNTEPTCMPLSGHFMDIEGRVLVHQTERYNVPTLFNLKCLLMTKAVPSTDFYTTFS